MKKIIFLLILLISFILGVFILSGNDSSNINTEDEQSAKETLITFFNNLANWQYEEALNYFYPESNSMYYGHSANREYYDWDLISKYSNRINASKAEQLADYCEITKSCLPIEIIETRTGDEFEYTFDVQFRKEDGSLLSYSSENITDSRRKNDETFVFKVVKKGIPGIRTRFFVTTPPVDTTE